MKKFILLFLFLSNFVSFSQNNLRTGNWCYTDEYNAELLRKHPEIIENYEMIEAQVRALQEQGYGLNGNQEASIIIPVVVHVIMDEDGSGYIDETQVQSGIDVLNRDFQKLNADTVNVHSIFKPLIANVDIEFRLATIDPNGNCTNGIVYVKSSKTNNADDGVKSVSYWNSQKYFNVWLVKSIGGGNGGTVLGYAQFPYSWGGGINNTYGLVVRQDYWGTTGTSNGDGRTATHEVGHCLGLYHTFQSGCGGNCSTSGDQVCDTPPAAQDTYGCDMNQNTCSNDASGPSAFSTDVVDMIENYMSYDACQYMFTLGQKSRMLSAISSISGLQNLTSSPNLAATGTADPYNPPLCAPKADFIWNYDMICEGASVDYTDRSWNGDATAWNWTFPGGTPSSSTQQNPTITYNTAGSYDATLNASNSAGSDTKTYTNVVYVSSANAQYSNWFYKEDFEDANTVASDWIIQNPSGYRTWIQTSLASATGGYSMMINNYSGTSVGETDALISPSYDLSQVPSPQLTFKYAYAQKNSSNDDWLKVYISTNCGKTWNLRFSKKGSQLNANNIIQNSNYVPATGDWIDATVYISAYASASNVRVKFEFISDQGNNIYIDDINIANPNSVQEFSALSSLQLYPNPAKEQTTLKLDLNKKVDNAEIVLLDVVGKKVADITNGNKIVKGNYTFTIETVNLPAGIYFVQVTLDGEKVIKKLMVQ